MAVKKWVISLIAVLLPTGIPILMGQDDDVREEEALEYFDKWLEEDVRYIISEEEKEIFENLTTVEEKERFVEQFWFRRDPDPRTVENEFKAEHYRRIAYANDRFQSGTAGWKSDRGRIYIIHGPPAEIVSYPSGGRYIRQAHEGSGATSTYPFEVWRYRDIDDIGQDIELEFVDKSWAGQYKLVMDPDEKDALLMVPGAGETLAESMGLARKMDRPYFQPGMRGRYPYQTRRTIDSPFARYERLVDVQKATPVKYKDLQELVQVDVSFDELPFKVRHDMFSLDGRKAIVPITVELENKELTYAGEGDVNVARVAVYGLVTSITGRIITEFDEDLILEAAPGDLQKTLRERSLYQRILILERGMPYRLDFVVKDLTSANVGVVRLGLKPPAYETGELAASSLIISDLIVPAPQDSAQDQMFVLGDMKVRPSVENTFSIENPLGLYLQLYEFGLDQATSSPVIEVRYRIIREGESVLELLGGERQALRLYSDSRAALIKVLPTDQLEPGEYVLEVRILDLVSGQDIFQSQKFVLVDPGRKTSAAAD